MDSELQKPSLNRIRSVRFSDLDMEHLSKVAARKGVTIGWLIRKLVRSGLDADAAEFYANPANRTTTGRMAFRRVGGS